MSIKRALIITLIAFILSGCSYFEDVAHDREIRAMRKEALEKLDEEKCTADGGRIEEVGLFAIPARVKYYADGGKPCRGSEECEDNCFMDKVLPVGSEVVGMCESSDHDAFGCFSRIEEGRVSFSMCQD